MLDNFLPIDLIKKNLSIIYKKKKSYIVTIFSSLFIAVIMFYFTDYKLTVGNMGLIHANVEIFFQFLIMIFFGINIGVLSYRLMHTNEVSIKSKGSTTLGSIFGIIVSGCPLCGITIASYLGLSSLIATLPFFGLELKVIGILLLLYSTITLLNKPFTCTIPKNKSKKKSNEKNK